MTYNGEGGRSVLRGDILLAADGRHYLAWSIGDDVLALLMSRDARRLVMREPVKRLCAGLFTKTGRRASGPMLELAAAVVNGLPDVAAEQYRYHTENEPDWDDNCPWSPTCAWHSQPGSTVGRYWDGDKLTENCYWRNARR